MVYLPHLMIKRADRWYWMYLLKHNVSRRLRLIREALEQIGPSVAEASKPQPRKLGP